MVWAVGRLGWLGDRRSPADRHRVYTVCYFLLSGRPCLHVIRPWGFVGFVLCLTAEILKVYFKSLYMTVLSSSSGGVALMEAEYDNEKFYFQEHPDAILGNYRIPNSLTDLLIHSSLRTPLDESIHGRFIT